MIIISTIQLMILSFIVVLLAVLLKNYNAVFGTVIIIFMCALILLAIMKISFSVFNQMDDYMKILDDNYIKIIIKAFIITLISEFVSGICKDNGYQALASCTEILCRISIFLLGMPIYRSILDLVKVCLSE